MERKLLLERSKVQGFKDEARHLDKELQAKANQMKQI